jgi:hypothetical protein
MHDPRGARVDLVKMTFRSLPVVSGALFWKAPGKDGHRGWPRD